VELLRDVREGWRPAFGPLVLHREERDLEEHVEEPVEHGPLVGRLEDIVVEDGRLHGLPRPYVAGQVLDDAGLGIGSRGEGDGDGEAREQHVFDVTS